MATACIRMVLLPTTIRVPRTQSAHQVAALGMVVAYCHHWAAEVPEHAIMQMEVARTDRRATKMTIVVPVAAWEMEAA